MVRYTLPHQHTKFGVPTSNNIRAMLRAWCKRTDTQGRQTDGQCYFYMPPFGHGIPLSDDHDQTGKVRLIVHIFSIELRVWKIHICAALYDLYIKYCPLGEGDWHKIWGIYRGFAQLKVNIPGISRTQGRGVVPNDWCILGVHKGYSYEKIHN